MFVLPDSNVWLSALTCDGFCRRVLDAAEPLCTFVTTPFICGEVREKLVMRFGWSTEHAEEVATRLASKSRVAPHVSTPVAEVRDPDDIPILAAAATHGCDFLVTGDKDVLAVRTFCGVRIVTVREFAKLLGLDID